MTKDLTGQTNKFRSIPEIMQIPGMRARLQSFADEAIKCKQTIKFEQENLKALRDNVAEELGIKPAIFNNYIDMLHKNDYIQRHDKFSELTDMVKAVMEDSNMPLTYDD